MNVQWCVDVVHKTSGWTVGFVSVAYVVAARSRANLGCTPGQRAGINQPYTTPAPAFHPSRDKLLCWSSFLFPDEKGAAHSFSFMQWTRQWLCFHLTLTPIVTIIHTFNLHVHVKMYRDDVKLLPSLQSDSLWCPKCASAPEPSDSMENREIKLKKCVFISFYIALIMSSCFVSKVPLSGDDQSRGVITGNMMCLHKYLTWFNIRTTWRLPPVHHSVLVSK